MQTAKLYKNYRPARMPDPDLEINQEDYEARALRALYTHRWLDEPDRRYIAQLKGGQSAWPSFIRDWQEYGREDAREPKPRLRAKDISDHDNVMPWFNGLAKRDFNILWLRGALEWEFQRIGDKCGRTRQWAHMRYRQAMQAVVTEAARGGFEI